MLRYPKNLGGLDTIVNYSASLICIPVCDIIVHLPFELLCARASMELNLCQNSNFGLQNSVRAIQSLQSSPCNAVLAIQSLQMLKLQSSPCNSVWGAKCVKNDVKRPIYISLPHIIYIERDIYISGVIFIYIIIDLNYY